MFLICLGVLLWHFTELLLRVLRCCTFNGCLVLWKQIMTLISDFLDTDFNAKTISLYIWCQFFDHYLMKFAVSLHVEFFALLLSICKSPPFPFLWGCYAVFMVLSVWTSFEHHISSIFWHLVTQNCVQRILFPSIPFHGLYLLLRYWCVWLFSYKIPCPVLENIQWGTFINHK